MLNKIPSINANLLIKVFFVIIIFESKKLIAMLLNMMNKYFALK